MSTVGAYHKKTLLKNFLKIINGNIVIDDNIIDHIAVDNNSITRTGKFDDTNIKFVPLW